MWQILRFQDFGKCQGRGPLGLIHGCMYLSTPTPINFLNKALNTQPMTGR